MTLETPRLRMCLRFVGPRLDRSGGAHPWTEAAIQLYVESAQRWLMVLEGVRGRAKHTLELDILEGYLPQEEGGYSWIDPAGIESIGSALLPTRGSISLSAWLVDPSAAARFGDESSWRAELRSTVLHELGHTLGIGLLWNLRRDERGIVRDELEPSLRWWATPSVAHQGPIYQQPAAIAAYNRLVGGSFDFVPLDQGEPLHPFGHSPHDPPRSSSDGRSIPPVPGELMSAGHLLSELSIGFLDDLGWEVDYDAADPGSIL